MKVACYVRVSTAGQNESGQRREIQRWLDGHGIKDAVYYVDKKSGDNLDRPAFKRLQSAIFAGEHDTVVVWKLDRLSRSLRDGINVLTDWIDAGVRVVATSQALDFSGSVGRLVASVLLAVAQMEQETRRERQAAGIAAARERGQYVGRKAGTTKAKPARAKQLRERGLTGREIAEALGVSLRTAMTYLNAC